ncbi:TCAM1 protein, partial [Erithacus rubecula]|nr:TCAM1 protein [Erithacus rubecula]
MAQSAELQPSFEEVFNILCQAPPEKLLSLKHKLHSRPGPCSKVLQAMVLLALGQETNARMCLDALRDEQAAQYIQQTKLGRAGAQEEGEAVQPPQLDAAAVALLAQVCTVLEQEKLCSAGARDRASQDSQQGTLSNVPAEEQDRQDSAASGDSGDGFRTLRSHEDTAFPCTGSPHYVLRSSPVQIRGSSEPSGPRSLCSESSSLPSCLEISASPTAAFHSQPSVPDSVPWASSAGHPDGDTESHGPQESSWASTASSPPGQDTAVPQPEEVLQASPCHPSPLPIPETPLPSEPVQSSDVPSTVTEPHTPRDKQDEKLKDERKKCSPGVPDPRAAVHTAATHSSIQDSYIPGIPCNPAPASTSSCSLPPPPYSFSSALPPLQEPHSNLSHPPPLRSSPSPGSPALQDPAVDPSEPEFFTFVVLHASEDEHVAHRVKNLLESLGVSNGATLSELLIPGRSHMTCFQEAMENSAFKILLLTKNFPCNLCLFHTDTALMESIQDPSQRDSVIPFLPRSNALEHSQIPKMLSVLVKMSESSPLFSRRVHRTFSPKRIREKRALWEQMQRRKLQDLQKLAALSLGPHPAPWPAE